MSRRLGAAASRPRGQGAAGKSPAFCRRSSRLSAGFAPRPGDGAAGKNRAFCQRSSLLSAGFASRKSRQMDDMRSRPVSRVLSRAIIPLGSTSPWTSSGLPGSARRSALRPLTDRNPRWTLLPYLALLQVGFAVPSLLPRPRCALTAPFHPCRSRRACRSSPRDLGGLFSVALSVGSRPPGVTWHLIRRSPDFPPPPTGP